MIDIKYDKRTIEIKRKQIANRLFEKSDNIKNPVIHQISEYDLQILWDCYDEIFFDHFFRESFPGKLEFSLSKRLTKSAGMTKAPKKIAQMNLEDVIFQIIIGVDFFFRYNEKNNQKVCGIEPGDSLSALLLVFEHELCHVIELISFRKSSCKKKTFKGLAYNLFGHLESHHEMPTLKSIAATEQNLHISDQVRFTYEDKRMDGFISNINKRATVMVRDNKGNFRNEKGIRFSKYYVPLGCLERII